ncbi:MAG: hypothetical protein AAF628_03540 [Planctomycetota bacterium]
MALATVLLLSLLAPQDPPAAGDLGLSSVLTEKDQASLNKAARAWFEAWDDYEKEEDGRRRMGLNKKLVRAKEKFLKDWENKSKKDDPLKHPGDLLAIFANVFPYGRESGTGALKSYKADAGSDYLAAVPRAYKADAQVPWVLVLPDRDESDEGWVEGKVHFENTWKDTPAAQTTLFVVPKLDDGIALDDVPDLSTETGDSLENQRIGAVLFPAGEAQRRFRTDRDRFILDCGRGSSAFGLRLATYFPSRFAGLILRDPKVAEDLPLDSLAGVPFALLANGDTKDAADQIAGQLNQLAEGSATVLDAESAELAATLSEWTAGVRRNLFRDKLVFVPTNDRFGKSYWLELGPRESIFAPPDVRPKVVVEADRAANRISITAQGVTDIVLYLSDAFVDLDKEFTLVVNGEAVTEKRDRSLFQMAELISTLFDSSWVFPATYATTVPKADGASGSGGRD